MPRILGVVLYFMALTALGAPPAVQAQDAHGVHYLRYWVDEVQGKVFCLVDAPSPEAAKTVHAEAHGLLADEIHPVVEGD